MWTVSGRLRRQKQRLFWLAKITFQRATNNIVLVFRARSLKYSFLSSSSSFLLVAPNWLQKHTSVCGRWRDILSGRWWWFDWAIAILCNFKCVCQIIFSIFVYIWESSKHSKFSRPYPIVSVFIWWRRRRSGRRSRCHRPCHCRRRLGSLYRREFSCNIFLSFVCIISFSSRIIYNFLSKRNHCFILTIYSFLFCF